MFVNKSKRYIQKYRVGGAGVFEKLAKLAQDCAGKAAAKELATAAISGAIEKEKQLFSKKLTQKNKELLQNLVKEGAAFKIQDLVRSMNGAGLKLAH